MPIQSLGIFDSVFDWVCDKLFDPVINWLSKILNSIFEWLLNNVVIPLLMPVFEFLWNIIIANIADIFFTFIYGGFCQWLWILDQLQSGFDILIGMKDITYYSESLGRNEQTTLLQYFMNNDIIRNALLSITFVALALSIIFSIYSVMRSTLDFDFEGKRPVGKVLNSVAKSMIAFLLVPTICVFGVSLVSIVLKQTCSAITGSDASLGRWILAISSMDAGRGNPPAQFLDPSTNQIADPWASLVYDGMDYASFGARIHISEVDYILGFASLIFMAIVMVICLFTFIKRIFDIIILYITSPYFVSTIVLDDGEKFKRWREMFIAKILVGFGSVIGLRIFLMMVPVIMSDQLQIFDSVAGNIAGGYVIRLVFILGGMYAVYKSSTLLTGIISSSAAAEENMNNALMGGLVSGGAMKGMKALAGAGKSAFNHIRSKNQFSSASDKKTRSSKFTGGTGAFNPRDYSKSFKSDFTGSLGLKADQINDDYISQDILDKEKEMEQGNDFDPLSKVDGLEDFNFQNDYISGADADGGEADFTGNADIDGIKSFGKMGSTVQAYDKFEMADNALKIKGERPADGADSKTHDFKLNSETLTKEDLTSDPELLNMIRDNRFDAADYIRNFKGDLNGSRNLKDNEIHDDHIRESNLDKKQLDKLLGRMSPLGDDKIKNFNFGGDHLSDILDSIDAGNSDRDGTMAFGENGGEDAPIPDEYIMSDDAIRRYEEADDGTSVFNGDIKNFEDNVTENDHRQNVVSGTNRDILGQSNGSEAYERTREENSTGGRAEQKISAARTPEIIKPVDPVKAAKRSDHKKDSAKF